MRAPVSWIREYVDLSADLTAEGLAVGSPRSGSSSSRSTRPGHDIEGPLVLGRVLTVEDEPQKNGKVIRWCTVDVG